MGLHCKQIFGRLIRKYWVKFSFLSVFCHCASHIGLFWSSSLPPIVLVQVRCALKSSGFTLTASALPLSLPSAHVCCQPNLPKPTAFCTSVQTHSRRWGEASLKSQIEGLLFNVGCETGHGKGKGCMLLNEQEP